MRYVVVLCGLFVATEASAIVVAPVVPRVTPRVVVPPARPAPKAATPTTPPVVVVPPAARTPCAKEKNECK